MAPDENPLRCLAVRVTRDAAGQINLTEVASFLDEVAGEGQWISSEEWLFIDPPLEAAGEVTLPAVMPMPAATRAVLHDLTNDPPRIVIDYQTTPAETRRWRWYASLDRPGGIGPSLFPWERADA